MKTIKISTVLMLFALILLPFVINGQNSGKEVKTHKIWVTLIDGSKEKGILYSSDLDGIKILNHNTLDVSDLKFVAVSHIDLIKIRRKGKVGQGVLVGALSGVGVGVLIGLASGDDDPGILSFSKEDKAAVGGITLGVLGTGIGALVASSKELIVINGSNENYLKKLEIIQSYALQTNESSIK